jgi:L-lactate dehydrogenase complex protein LldF
LIGVDKAPTLPYASTLCGACYEVCPVKIDIPNVLLHLRSQVVEHKGMSTERIAMRATGWIFGSARRLRAAQRLGRLAQASLVRGGSIRRLPGPLAGWTKGRTMKPVARESFRTWWSKRP